MRAWEIAARDIELSSDSRQTLEAKFLRDLHENADAVLVAEVSGTICGWGARIPHSNYISDLWINPPYQGQGIGGRILDALMAQILLDGFTEAEIGAHADNFPAIGLYEKAGFRVYERGKEWSESFGRDVEKVRMRAKL